jgi:hypothetical protein
MMATTDYDALAAQLGGSDYTPQAIDYDALAASLGGRDTVPSTMADVGKSAAYAIPKAITGLAGLPGDLRDLSAAARSKIISWLPDSIQPAVTGVSNFGDYMNPITALVKGMPTSGQLRGGAEQVTGPWYDPQTRAGKVADTAVQTAALMGRNWLTTPLKTAALVGGQTAGTEIAGAQTDDNPWARFGGGLLGGGTAALANAYTSAPAKAVQQAVGDLTPAQIAAAQAKQDAARVAGGPLAGVPLMGPEALPDSGIQQLASDVAASRSGGAVIRSFLAQRPNQVRAAVQGGLLGTIGAPNDPLGNAATAQNAATQVISNAERARTAATRPLYQAAATDTVPPADVQAIIDGAKAKAATTDPDYARALSKFAADITQPQPGVAASPILGPDGAPLFPGVPATTVPRTGVGPLSDTFKRVRNSLDMPAINATPEDRIAQGILGPFNQQLGTAIGNASPAWSNANAAYQAITRNNIDPLTSGSVGIVAGRSGFDPSAPSSVPRITSAVANTDVARPDSIRSLYTNLNGVDPTAFPGIARTWLQNAFDDATQRVQSGDNRMMGANFAKAVYGTDQQRANFEEVLRGVAQANGVDPDQYVAGASKLMQTLEATGRVPGVGSPTAGRGALTDQLEKSKLADAVNLASAAPLKGWTERLNSWLAAGRYRQLAQVFTAPDSVQQIARFADLAPSGLTAKYLAASLLGLDRAIASP